MQTTIAQQLILFSFLASVTMLTLVGAIMMVSISRLMRIQRLELAYVHANTRTSTSTNIKPASTITPLASKRDTRPKPPSGLVREIKSVDIQIKPVVDTKVTPPPYKPTATPNRTEKVG